MRGRIERDKEWEEKKKEKKERKRKTKRKINKTFTRTKQITSTPAKEHETLGKA